jgi:HK97 gp10 family phage protein
MSDLYLDDRALGQVFDSPRGFVAEELLRRGVQVERAAKIGCPVDTGRLRASIVTAIGEDGRGLFVDIGTDVVYAPYVELGTSRQPGQPFLRPALRAGSDR